MPKIISIDLDGVLNTYNGKFEHNKLSPIKEGAFEFLRDLAKDYSIEIFTVRDNELTKEWLIENNLMRFVNNITNKKNPYASVILDDRAITFNGDYTNAYNQIINFQPHWK